MRRIYFKDKLSRKTRLKKEAEILVLTSVLKHTSLPTQFKLNLAVRLLASGQNSPSIRNVCKATSRSRGIFRLFKLSRIQLRDRGLAGLLPGLVKQ